MLMIVVALVSVWVFNLDFELRLTLFGLFEQLLVLLDLFLDLIAH